MSYASLARTLPPPLRQPIGLAALGSLGIHGLLWTILPVLPLKPKPSAAQQPQTVGIVELTPFEQSRLPLPQVAPSPSAQQQNDLPPLPPESSVLPPLPPEPSVLPPLPPLPATGSLAPPDITSLPALPSRATMPPPPPASLLTSPKKITLPKYRLSAPQPSTPPSNLSKLSESEPRRIGSFPPPPFIQHPNRGLPNLPLTPAQLPPPPATALNPIPGGNMNQPPERETAAAAAQTSATASAHPENSSVSRQKLLAELMDRQREQSERTTTFATRPARLPESGREQLLALQQQWRERYQRTKPTATSGSNQPASPLPYRNPVDSISPATANRDALIAAYAQRQRVVQAEHPNVETKAPIYKTINTCQKQLDRSVAVVGVIVNPQGNIIEGPDLLNQAAPSVKQAAEKFVRGYSFSGNAKPANYSFNLKYKYNTGNCAEASPNSDNRQPAPQPQSERLH